MSARRRTATSGLLAEGVIEIGVDKWFDVAIQHLFGVGSFAAGSQVLDLLVGVQYVRADLIPQLRRLIRAFQLANLFFVLFHLQRDEFGTQDGHGRFFVLQLAAFVLDGYGYAGRKVRDTYRR